MVSSNKQTELRGGGIEKSGGVFGSQREGGKRGGLEGAEDSVYSTDNQPRSTPMFEDRSKSQSEEKRRGKKSRRSKEGKGLKSVFNARKKTCRKRKRTVFRKVMEGRD